MKYALPAGAKILSFVIGKGGSVEEEVVGFLEGELESFCYRRVFSLLTRGFFTVREVIGLGEGVVARGWVREGLEA